jgi:hypothetical protein
MRVLYLAIPGSTASAGSALRLLGVRRLLLKFLFLAFLFLDVQVLGLAGTGSPGSLGGVLGSILLPRLLYYLQCARCVSRAAREVFQKRFIKRYI